jgi:hypothetical protein
MGDAILEIISWLMHAVCYAIAATFLFGLVAVAASSDYGQLGIVVLLCLVAFHAQPLRPFRPFTRPTEPPDTSEDNAAA